MTTSEDRPSTLDPRAGDAEREARTTQIERRKREHVELAAGEELPSGGRAGFDDVQLVHEALPEAAPEHIDTSVELLGKRLRLPLVIAAMTGGFAGGETINTTLARAAERHGLAMGVGSQRAALIEPALARTYAAAREAAPTALLIANIGVAQLVPQADRPAVEPAEIEALIAMIRADALAIHLNAVQELVQPEGQPDARGWLAAIEAVAGRVSVPVIAKETGAGVSATTAVRLRGAGVAVLDVGGRGGTSFAAIEAARARQTHDSRGVLLGELLASWGIPTLVSVALASGSGLPVIATGGVRTGLDAAKAIAMGATAVGVARPLLQAALAGDAAVDEWIERFASGLVAAMYLTGSRDVPSLRRAARVVTGEAREWIRQLEEDANG
ncbi:MAG: type 2 isopentenyl-diphosphate Delta-isomerase [Chloroflexota bacterium]